MEDPILHLAVHLTLVGALREGEVAGLTPEDLDFEGADGTGTFRSNKCTHRVPWPAAFQRHLSADDLRR